MESKIKDEEIEGCVRVALVLLALSVTVLFSAIAVGLMFGAAYGFIVLALYSLFMSICFRRAVKKMEKSE